MSTLGYTKNSQATRAIELFFAMEKNGLLRGNDLKAIAELSTDPTWVGVESSMVVYLCTITALSHIAMLETSELIVDDIPSCILHHPRVQNALVDMWVSASARHRLCFHCVKRIGLGQSWLRGKGARNLRDHPSARPYRIHCHEFVNLDVSRDFLSMCVPMP